MENLMKNIAFECEKCGTIIKVLQLHVKAIKKPSLCKCGNYEGFKKIGVEDNENAKVIHNRC